MVAMITSVVEVHLIHKIMIKYYEGFARVSIGQNIEMYINTKLEIIKKSLQCNKINPTIYLFLRDNFFFYLQYI